ncbi:MAG: lipopolysaccharide biosynthesis protein [Bacteroidetes bacterium]|uniref:lipopolysaccharide biosynthesis protein n=1 Tax=Flavobacterium sp. TaxID=239 RepID=UPI002FD9B0AB|nr:lipopolysaccharide biosynthesis protein [Bacteroidota bacterium]
MSLTNKTFSGLKWTFLDTFFLKGSLFIFTLFLARLVGPAEFGLIGILTVFISVGNALVDGGLSISLIRSLNTDSKDYSTVFITNLIFSLIIYLILFFTANYISNFFKQPLLCNLIRVYCLSFILSAFSSIQIAILIKNLKFKKLTILNIPGTIIGLIFSLYLVNEGLGVWSLVVMYLTSQLINTVLLWKHSEWKPTLEFSKQKFDLHFFYGYKLMIATVIDTLFKNIYNLIIGKFYSIKTLGYFDRAQSLNEYPITVIVGIINKVSYPILSEMQNDKDKIADSYKKLMKTTFFITTPLIFSVIMIAKPLFLLVLGKEWIEASNFFQILCLASIFYPIHAFNIIVLKIYGRTDLYLNIEILKKIIIVLSITALFSFGIYGLIWSNFITSVIALIINTKYSSKLINYSFKNQIYDMFPVILSSTIMAFLMYFVLMQIEKYSLFLQILIPIAVGYLFYFSYNVMIKNRSIIYILNLIKKQ